MARRRPIRPADFPSPAAAASVRENLPKRPMTPAQRARITGVRPIRPADFPIPAFAGSVREDLPKRPMTPAERKRIIQPGGRRRALLGRMKP